MKVQRCSSCHARYKVDRLEVGARFECSRCHALVTVEAGAAGGGTSVGLLVAGLLLLVALFLYANPAFGEVKAWPWQHAPEGGVTLTTVYAAWALLALWAVVTALLPGATRRSVLTVGLGAAALAIATSGGLPDLQIVGGRNAVWMLGVTGLLGGLTLLASGRTGVVARSLALGGGLTLLVLNATAFHTDGTVVLVRAGQDVVAAIRGTLPAELAGAPYVWSSIVAPAVVLVAAIGGVLAGLGISARAWAAGTSLVLLLGMLIPGAVRVGQGFEPGFDLARVPQVLNHGVATSLVYDGVALWLLVGLAAADLVRQGGNEA